MKTSTPPRPARWSALLIAGLALVLLGGCSAPAPAAGEAPEGPAGTAPAGAPQQPNAEPEPNGGAPQAPSLPTNSQIVRSATVTLVVDEVEAAAAELRRVAGVVGGMVTSESISMPVEDVRYDDSYLVLTVPAARFDQTLTLIDGLGEVRQRAVDSVDVTDAVVDVDSRVRTMRASVARLQAIMDRAGSIRDVAEVEAELTQRQSELEALLAQQQSLARQVATSPITVTLVTPETAPEPEPEPPRGFLAGLATGWSAMVATTTIGLTIFGAFLPWLVLGAVSAVPVWLWRRRTRARAAAARMPEPSAPNDSGPSAQE